MSTTVDRPPRRSPLLPTLGIASVIVVAFILFTGVWTDRLWFSALGYGQVFAIALGTRIGMFVTFGLVMGLIVAGNAALAYRMRPPINRAPVTSELLERGREVLEHRSSRIILVLGILFGLFGGIAAASQAPTFLAWRNRTPFGIQDPRFGLDIAFYVFDYPWWRLVLSNLLVALLFSAAAVAIVHYVMGTLRYVRGRKLTSATAQIHLSILLGLALLLYAAQQWMDRYGFLVTTNSLFTGINYTNDHAQVSGRTILAAIAVVCAIVFFANAVLRRWVFPMLAITLMILSGLILGAIYPTAVQAISVRPDEPDKERPYIEQHIQATRQAYGVNDVAMTDYAAETTATPGQLRADAEALPGIRLIDPSVVAPAYEQLQQVRGYYSFPKVLDVDRYRINGQETDAVVAAREMDHAGLDNQSWNNVHTVYTHGYGLVAAYGNRRQPGGEPEWISRDIPPTGEISQPEPRIYYGEMNNTYSIVGAPAGAPPIELDTPGGGAEGGPKLTTYSGKGGVDIGNLFNRLLYATKFADINILLSDRVNEASRIIYDRTPKERVQEVAPWLTTDSDVYPAVVEGRIVWIVDGYTTSNFYPNSQRTTLTPDGQQSTPANATNINYIRNSVKGVVDAYDGSVTLYAWDEADPVLQTWRKAYPGVIQDRSAISRDLLAHLRYPSDLFRMQRQILARYHVTDPQLWYQQTDLWEVPDDPVRPGTQELPYYLSVKWPGDDQAIFSNTAVYVPNGRSNLAAYMAVNAEATSPDYGKLRILRMADTHQIDGPGQTFNAMTNDTKVAERLRTYIQGAAAVQYGNLLTLPVGGGLLYVQPVYTQRQGSTGSYPLLRFVVVRFGETVGVGDTLQEALDQVFQGNSGADTGEETGQTRPNDNQNTGQTDNAAASRALQDAETAFAAADAALKKGDLATYQAETDKAHEAVKRATRALGG